MCTKHKVNTVCAHNTHISTKENGLLNLFEIPPRKLETWLTKSGLLLVYFIVSQAITLSLPADVRNFLISKHRTVYKIHTAPCIKVTGRSVCNFLPNLYFYPARRSIRSNHKRSLILNIVLTSRRKPSQF